MKIKNQVLCTGIKASKGTIDGGMAYDSTTFHLIVDVAENSTGGSIGAVTRPFKFGTSEEFDKWAHLKNSWPQGGMMVDAEFELVAASDNKSSLVLRAIKPAPGAVANKAI